jgi:hypothetical protein
VIAGGLVAAADLPRERDLLLNGQKGCLADLLKVNLQVAAVRGSGGRGVLVCMRYLFED